MSQKYMLIRRTCMHCVKLSVVSRHTIQRLTVT